MVSAAQQIDVRPALAAVRHFHLENSQIRVLRDHVYVGFGEPLSRDAGHLQPVERILGDFLCKSGHSHAELFGEMSGDIDGMPVSRLSCQYTEGPRYFAKDL